MLEFCLELAKEDQNALEAMITLVHVHSQKVESLEYALAVWVGLCRFVRCWL